ncbi:MAG: Helix-turn-helix domain [Thermomicrobiales bacterium]|jgi:excisionase family DNA binding protein|nr:Helix-turn-helix domain [Thermomicrobiales bacterium]
MVAQSDEFVTVAEAASLLRVAPSTVRRWIREGNVAAYRLGQRRIGLRRGDLASLITPVREERERASDESEEGTVPPRRLTPEERDRGLAALERMIALSDQILAERGGKPFSPSWELLNEARDERTRQLG